MQSTSWETLGWKKHKLESRFPGEISVTSEWHHPMAESEEALKSLLMKVKKESEKAGLKLNIQKMKTMASCPITSWQIDEETMEMVRDFYFLGLQNHCRWWLQPWNLAPWKKSYDQPRQRIKKQRHYFANKGPSSQSYGFPSSHVWMWIWTIKKVEHWRIDAFELWCWERLLRVPWTARRSKQSILKKSALSIHWKD